jgi:hypothetical protein
MDGQQAPTEASKADFVKDGALGLKARFKHVIVDPKRVCNNGKKRS